MIFGLSNYVISEMQDLQKTNCEPENQSFGGKLSAVGLFVEAGLEKPNDLDHFIFFKAFHPNEVIG